MKKLSSVFVAMCLFFIANAQLSFTLNNGLIDNQSFFSGVAIGVTDMNHDGRDDLIHMKDGTVLQIEYQNGPNEPFTSFEIGEMAPQSVWSMCIGDVDNNGFPDVMTGGAYDGVHLARANADGSSYTIETSNVNQLFVQGSNFADIDGDGWLDYFACHDDGPAKTWHNDGTGVLTETPTLMNLAIFPPPVGNEDDNNSGNYGTVWTDFDNDGDWDLYIAKCRQGVNDPNDVRRINQLWVNNGDGTYTENAAAYGLKIGAQSWTADFGDIDNDGDMDCFITNHDVQSMLLENDGTGHFTDISAAAGVNIVPGEPLEGVFRDFDNDGYLDIIVAGPSAIFFKNNGNKTFSKVTGLFDNNQMESFAIGDFNHDGFLDVYGGYANVYTNPSNIEDKLWVNDGNANHFFGLNLEGSVSNKDGVHSRITIFTPAGKQIREVRSGESYGIMNSMATVFGLGATTSIDSVVVHWPSGIVDVIKNPAIDQYTKLNEGGCVLPPIVATALTSTTICTGQTVEIEGPAGYVYQWSNGATTQQIAVTEAGRYKVTVTSPLGCKSVSNSILVTVDPIETPQIKATGDTIFCKGGSVVLTSSNSTSYLWNNGATTNSITVSQNGSYFVTTQGLCKTWDSAPILVQALPSPTPTTTGDLVGLNGAASLEATGSEAHWFDAAVGGNELGIGSPFLTAPLATTTTFYVENHENYPGDHFEVGQVNHAGVQYGAATYSGEIIFDSYTPFILGSVKMYTVTPGVRHIEVLDANDNKLVGKSIYVPNGINTVDIEMTIPAGNGLRIRTNPDTNQVNFNSAGPKLRRSDSGVEYPYVVQNVVSLNTSNAGTDRYYYFYDWKIRTPDRICISDRVPVIATVDPNMIATNNLLENVHFTAYPNPASQSVSFEIETPVGSVSKLEMTNGLGQRFSEKIIESQGKTSITEDVSSLARGVYFVKLSTELGVKTIRVVLN